MAGMGADVNRDALVVGGGTEGMERLKIASI
jgi:hypothetical protein